MTTISDPVAYKTTTAQMDALRVKMEQVRLSVGKESAQWKELHAQYLILKKDRMETMGGLALEGAGLEGLRVS